ncbi:hypothetical protein FisN_15Hh261 [Fistulifera solaris]|uniref:Uncharacterized protein n=1 Tax=Fistulifera solaris TaxID=1519565 RepID=A0A1Z5JFW1_FISSO|nr:hypothetical protein FisN_15Hh261 [Fistulifera solaris]|eukprot:GAX12782.1 hypothetical protein FisN_15Hh261 [Fistulifera solaris]
MTSEADEEDEDAVRALAARLAPSLEQAEALLTHTLHSIPSTSHMAEEDDDMDQEMQDLQHAEDLLRRELDQVHWEEDLPISDEEEWQKTDSTPHSPSSFYTTNGETASPTTLKATRYRQEDHMTVLQLSATAHQPRNHLYRVNMTNHLSNTSCRIPVVQEWVVAPSEDTLKQTVVGLQPSTNLDTSHVTTLPIRTVTIRIRPDVLCGTVMEALHHALGKQNAEIDKRQGGHMQATWSQQYDVDLQLVTEQSTLERQLLLRLFYNSNHHEESTDSLTSSRKSEQDELVDIQYLIENGLFLNDDVDEEDPSTLVSTKDAPSLHLRECAALIQRIETPQSSRKPIRLSSNPLTKQSMQQAVSAHLLENYIACPSVKEGFSTLPALNAQDYQVIQSSWQLIETIWDELDTRDLLYSSLEHSPFGAFPALPTLDVQYCGQLRRLSRDRLIQQLLKGAGELEEFAREAEYACANMIALLKPTFQMYGIPETPLPQPVSLNDYSLDFTPPHVACPPWGLSVQSALSQIQTWTKEESEGESSMIKADNAVNLVFNALQMQDDEEQTARLDRKNRQVMDRLAAMQSHEKAMIDDIEAEATVKAILAANDFEAVAKVRQVPLVTWSFLPGTTGTGSCTVTSQFILFSTRRIPIIGGTRTQLFALKDVEFEVSTEKTSLLNPFSSFIRVLNRRQEEVFRFWPSMGAVRLKSFLDRLKINPLLETFETQ